MISGDFVKIVEYDDRYYVIDKDGKVLSNTDSEESAINYAKARWAVEPDIIEDDNAIYVGRIFVLRRESDLGWVISKGAEILYILDDKEKALEVLKGL